MMTSGKTVFKASSLPVAIQKEMNRKGVGKTSSDVMAALKSWRSSEKSEGCNPKTRENSVTASMLYEIFGHHCGPDVASTDQTWNVSTMNSRTKRLDDLRLPSLTRTASAFNVEPFQNFFGKPISTTVQMHF